MVSKATNPLLIRPSSLNYHTTDFYFKPVSSKLKLSIDSFQSIFGSSAHKQRPLMTTSSSHYRCISVNTQQTTSPLHSSGKSFRPTHENSQGLCKGKQLKPSLTSSDIHLSSKASVKSTQSKFQYQKYLNHYISPEKAELKKQLLLQTLRGNKGKKQQTNPSPYVLKPKPKPKEVQFNRSNLSNSPSSRLQYTNNNSNALNFKQKPMKINQINIQNNPFFNLK